VESAVSADLTISVFSHEHLNACRRAYERLGIKPKVHIKIDTGMNRIGVCADEAAEFIREVQRADFAGILELRGIFTHFANAENREKTQLQIDKWNGIIEQIDTAGLLLHVANTAGLLCYDIPNTNMVRAGIALYGLLPDLPSPPEFYPALDAQHHISLKPVMSLKARVVHIHEICSDEGVSYGHSFVAEEAGKIATIPIGYADGVRRELSNKISGTIQSCGSLAVIPQIGNITMDQMMLDVTGVDVKEGDVVTLLGEDRTIDDWAKILGTINYTLTCGLKVRLPRVYTR
jgi:alanine racemase